MSTLNKAIEIASIAHEGQFDKAEDIYILHPLRVMMSLDTDEEKIVGVLHDVIEDTDLTYNDLRNLGFPDEIIDALDSVTKRDNEDYFTFIERSKQNKIGRKVKLADLKDNMDWSRIKNPSEKDVSRMQKYQKAYFILQWR